MQELPVPKKMTIFKSGHFALGLILLACMGCSGLNKKPLTAKELVGQWTTADGKALMTLNESGDFLLSNAPGFFSWPTAKAQNGSGSGTWKLLKRDGADCLQLNFTKVSNNKGLPLPYGVPLEIAKRGSEWSLEYFIGDPDNGRKVTFQMKR